MLSGRSRGRRRRLDPVLHLLAQVEEPDGFQLPEEPGSALVWVIFLGIVVVLWMVVGRTRRRAEQEYWERRRREEEGRR